MNLLPVMLFFGDLFHNQNLYNLSSLLEIQSMLLKICLEIYIRNINYFYPVFILQLLLPYICTNPVNKDI